MPHLDSDRLPPDFVRLNIAQFCGALIDNIFKLFAMLFLIRLQGSEDAATITATASAIFVLPFLLFSAAAGVLADRYSKRTVLVASKVFELAVMLAAVLAFQRTQPLFLYAILFLISLQSTLYGPSKYGIVPELVLPAQLSRANSLLVMFTFLAIIAGTALAPLALDLTGGNYSLAQTACIAASVAGLVATLGIRRTPPAGSTARINLLFVRDIWRTLWSIRQDRYLVQAVLASAYFMMLGAYLQLNMIPYGIQHLGLTEQGSGYLFFVVALGRGGRRLPGGQALRPQHRIRHRAAGRRSPDLLHRVPESPASHARPGCPGRLRGRRRRRPLRGPRRFLHPIESASGKARRNPGRRRIHQLDGRAGGGRTRPDDGAAGVVRRHGLSPAGRADDSHSPSSRCGSSRISCCASCCC
jgi:MFS family permease